MGFSGNPAGELIVSGSDIQWVILPDEGLFAFKINGSAENILDDQARKIAVQSRFSNGTATLINQFSEISCIAEDNNRELWVGTGSGVVVYTNPGKVFDQGEFYGIQPSLEDGEGLFKPILEKEKITAIAVDGGNRKWFGTAHSGVFLFSEEGGQLLNHFDSKNSPLLSDRIISIAISQKSGEVFFATGRGLSSFKSDATSGESDLSNAYVWPNPLRETFEGEVTIDGLTEGTDIRITDISGNLVYRSTSIGGRAVWNARNSAGERVATGVYLIFCSSPQVTKSKVIKLLVIH
jgi:ligand-binding sensor domain-containing protein